MLRWLASAVNALEVAQCFSERGASMILAFRRHIVSHMAQPEHVDALSGNFYLALEWLLSVNDPSSPPTQAAIEQLNDPLDIFCQPQSRPAAVVHLPAQVSEPRSKNARNKNKPSVKPPEITIAEQWARPGEPSTSGPA
ncbi:hypothetical protein FB107DRAFT_276261 [Schizophyllum commune]